jgi:UDP-glucose 4-epimerase
MKVMVTGAGGFIGQKLCTVLEEAGFDIVPVFRTRQPARKQGAGSAAVAKIIDARTDWTKELIDVQVVVHLAARVHVMHGSGSSNLAKFREINVEGTRNLARQAAQSGVSRFIYLSSIKVNGEETTGRPFHSGQTPDPKDTYAWSKLEAEKALRQIEETLGIGVVIIRPPLVYGPGVKGNMLTLINMVRTGIPLPFGAINNRRDLVSVYNLCDLIRVCILHPAAPGRTLLVSDNESISTPDLIQYVAKGQNRNARLVAVPLWALKSLAGIFGKMDKLGKLTGNLQIDISRTQQALDWHPPLTMTESFSKMFAEG